MSQLCYITYYASQTTATGSMLTSICQLIRSHELRSARQLYHAETVFPVANEVGFEGADPNRVTEICNPTIEMAAKLLTPETTVSVSFGTSFIVERFESLLQECVSAETLGNFAVNAADCTLGNHTLAFEDPFSGDEIRHTGLSFSFSVWGYGTPSDHDAFFDVIHSHPRMLAFKSELEAIAGKTHVGVFYSV